MNSVAESIDSFLAVPSVATDPFYLGSIALVASVIAFLLSVVAFVTARRYRATIARLEDAVRHLRHAEDARFHADLVARGLLATDDRPLDALSPNEKREKGETARLVNVEPA